MKIIELVRDLNEKNINIESRDGELDIVVNENNLSEDLLNRIKNNKRQLMDYLENNCIKRSTSDFTFDGLKSKEYKKILADNQIPDSNVDDIYNLTPLQEGFLFHSIMDKNSLAYFEQISLDLKGDLDLSLFKEGWQQVVNLYDPLRTMFISDYRIPLQVVLKYRDFDFTFVDIREKDNKAMLFDEIRRLDRNKNFNLKNDPLVRLKLIRIEENQYTLILSFHHIILDGWCLPIIISRFMDNYSKLVKGEKVSIDSTTKYSDFIYWLNNRDKATDLGYWKSFLEGYKDQTSVPQFGMVEYKGLEHQSTYSFSIDPVQTESLKTLADETCVTLNTMIQTIWGIVLSKYNGTDDVVFGSTVSGRPEEIDLIEEMVGLFINTIPVRIKADRDKSFNQLALEVQRTALESLDYHYSSLADIHNESELGNTLLDHILVFENYPIDKALQENDSSILEIGNVESFEQINYNFGITVFPGESLDFRFCYNPEKYNKESLERIASHIKNAISNILSNNDITVGEIDIIPVEEKNLLLYMFNDTKTDYPSDKTITQLFEEQVERTPDNIAIVFGNIELSYRALNEKANAVGHYLRDNYNVEPDDLVGVVLPRSEKMIIALLGILKSGGAYVPIDPEYPEDRIDYMLSDSNPKVVVSDKKEDLFADINEILNSTLSTDNLVKYKNPDNLAYVIYTSGSTGKPKGVMVQEQGIVNFLFAFSGQFEDKITTNDNFISIVNTSFDVSVSEIFSPLLFGASLYLYKDITLDINDYCRYLEDNKITFAYIHPGLLKDVAKNLDKENIALNKLLVGVEGIQDTTLNEYLDLGNIQIINGYGPSEDTICATFLKYSTKTQTGRNVSIGSPISNTQIYILDKDSNLTPLGVAGELCISGFGLARGYLNRPELTIKKFVVNPFITGMRMYRTGDLARWLPDGNIEFLGRLDNQVKIRGFRIELEEIESSIVQHEGINLAVVLANEGTGEYKQLIAYYSSENELEVSEIRDFLAKSLPDYMVPSYFIHMETFPLTPNGKVDRKVLPELDGTTSTGMEYVAPRNRIEEILTEIWQEILGVDKIGILDNFFELGGHSLKATRVVSRISKELEVEIALKSIFETPTVELIAIKISQSSKKRYKQIEVTPYQESYELSNAQKRLWILDQLEEESLAYNMPTSFSMDGEFNEVAFGKTYSYIMERHESLRTVFISENGEPRQRILENPDFSLKIIDLREAVDKRNKTRELVEKDLLTPFNLEKGPLIRFTILRLEDNKYLLQFNMHHIISDGWSMNILIREFLSAYNSFRRGESCEPDPLRIHYKDYSVWQNELLESPEMEKQRNYWMEKLMGDIPVVNLPSDNVRPIVQTFNGSNIDFILSKEMTLQLNDMCRDNQISMFMMLQTLVKTLFYRYSGQNDIILGSPIAGRVHQDLENQIGFYVNTLIYRDSISSGQTFNELLGSVRKTCTEAFENQDYPFDKLVEELDIKRDLSRSPLFDIMLVLQNNETTDIDFDGLTVSPYETEYLYSKFDITLNFAESREGLVCGIEYNTDIYSEDRIERMREHFITLVSSAMENSESRISDLDIIPEEEKNLLLNTFNNTKNDYPVDKTIIDLFEEQVEMTPENIAVIFEDVELTYREVNQKANIVGHHLRDIYGIKQDDLVGVMLQRSEKMIIAILGILKSGAVYVPIDPEYPQERINFILEDSNPGIVLSETNIGLSIDINSILDSANSSGNLVRISNPVSPAYIIYTSGSTGRPKGVLLEHGSVVNLILSQKSLYRFDDNERILQFSNICFDASVEQIWLAFLSGASLVLISKEILLSHEKFNSYICEKKITHLDTVPSFLGAIEFSQNNHLKRIILGGEDFPIDIARKYFGEIELFNCYGPTETTVTSICYKIDSLSDGQGQIPIGKPISNTRVYILDEECNLLPMGVSGELYISGSGLAKGYLNRPELTDEMFVENPLVPGEMIYRTGDLVRWLSDGNLVFLGRIDDQVKIRGFRIELDEIDKTLLQHEDIGYSLVIAKEILDGDKQLVAYYSSVKGLEISDIRSFLGKSLPYYMIPSYFIHMETFPLTPNGKIDRKALPEPYGTISTGVEYIAPRNKVEEKLIEIWQEILGNGNIGILDNFFELGGHSLKAMRIVSRISKDFEVEILLKDIFSNPTIESLSKIINLSTNKVFRPIEVISRQECYEVSNSQKRLWVLDQLEEDSVAYNMPGAFILEGEFNEKAFKKAYSYIINRHESLRTVFQTENGNPRQRILDNPDFNIEITDCRNILDKDVKVEEIVGMNLSTPFDLSKGPLIRFALIRLEDEKYIILFNMHHIVSDGWSINILTRDFLVSYNSFRRNQTPDLEPLRIHYKEYSSWQNTLLEGPEIEEQRDYWLEKLSGELPVLDLPADRIRPSVQTFNGDHFGLTLSKEIQSGLYDLCRRNKVSLFMMLQALVKVLLHKYSGQQDIIIGSPIAGRVHQDLENQIGFYLNNLVLRDPVRSEDSFSGFLEITAQTCSEAFENHNYPFDRIVEDLDLKRDLSRSPLFDILVILQNNETTELEFDGLTVLPYQAETVGEASKFDITFDFTEVTDGIHCVLKYNTDIYSSDRIKRMGRHLETLVSSVIENPGSKLKDLEILSVNEKNMILNLFNDTKANYSFDKTIVDIFEEQVEKTPDNIAVVFDDLELSYGELNGKANMVAHYLFDKHGVERSDFIAVLLERSEKMIIAILGILKTGAAYVPVDPEYPGIRIEYMLEDSDPKHIIGNRQEDNYLDINQILESGMSTSNPGCNIDTGTSCHLIYTSGTTGKPKGIVAKHKNITNFIHWGSDYYFNDGIEGNFGLFTSISYDFTSTSIFLTLLRGKTLVIFNQDTEIQFLLKEVFKSATIDSTKLTPAHISLLDQLGIENSSMKLVLTSGEELKEDHIDILRGINRDIRIVNGYGTTELPTSCIVREIDNSDGKILIGKPINNIEVFVMNNDMLAPIGIPGELCVSGSGVAKGYLNRPELTSEKFVPGPLNPDEMMYRTGDLARWLPDGNLEFLGRMDHQIKIRGFRIEPGEIESQMVDYHGISSVVVVAKEGIDGDKLLTAYIVSDNELIIPDLRDYLGKSLPDYMIPSFFISMESFPLTPNGKIDRKALPEPDGTFSSGVEYISPKDGTEEKLVDIWQEVLGLDRIGVLDNFFELGGHSLKATRVVSRISKDLEVEITLKDIFSNPTIESLSKVATRSVKTNYHQIETIGIQDSYGLSNAQRRLWILDQLKEDSLVYNMPCAFYLEGEFDEESFRKAYLFIVERHESLRTVVIVKNGEPRQKILENPPLNFEIIDLRETEDKDERIRQLVEKDIKTSFKLGEGSLIRFTLLREEDGKYLLLFNMHHIISDGWSMNVFTREFLHAYNNFRRNKIPELLPLRIHYKDYSAWQNNLLESEEIKRQKEYWLDKLSGELMVLNLPSDNVRPASQTFNGNRTDLSFPLAMKNALNAICIEYKISLFMMLQALVKVLVYRYTGQSDIIFGSPVAGRVHEDLEDQIGFFVNTVPLRDIVDGDLSFNEFLKGVGRTCTEAFDNQDYPFDRIVEDFDIKRDISRSPLFDVMLVLQNNESTAVKFEGLEFTPYDSDIVISKFDMTFNFSEGEEALYCSIEYNTDIYAEDRIERMGEHLKTLISSILDNPEARIKDLEIIPAEEKNLLLNVFNDTKADYPRDKTIVDLFEEQVDRTPDNVAVVFEDVELTYREVNEKANIIGHYLRDDYNIEPDDLVGIMLERSEKMIIALFGVLKSGAAYVPIDSEYPQDRIDYMFLDSKPKVVLGERKGLAVNNIKVIDINEVLESAQSIKNPATTTTPKHLAYVIYTSGSTGKPKGVMLENRNVINLLFWHINEFELSQVDVVSQYASISFDASVWEIFPPLISGASVHVLNHENRMNLDELASYIRRNFVSVSFLPTPIYEEFRKRENLELRVIITGGDKLKSYYPNNYKLYNNYGPTENSVVSTSYYVENNSRNIPIGSPISNTLVYILNKNLNLLPCGVPGELCVSGAGLARGYLNIPELTAEKFVDNPFVTGERIYRTGDLARWLPDGNIEFLGRIDNQVKIRGFRIEPGEIENSISKHKEISTSIVLVKEISDGEKLLVAYYVSEKELEISEIRSFLRKFLPDYMIPSFFIHMETLPLTPNGKIDRKALPESDGTYSTGVEYVAPRNETEEKLAGIWQEVLDVEQIGIYDNFFDLGGYSIKATRILSRISRNFQVNVTLKDIFDNPTVKYLSILLSQSVKKEYNQIESIQKQGSYELSNSQKRLWVLAQLDVDNLAYNLPNAFVLEGEFIEGAFREAYLYIVERHESLRTVFLTENGEPRQRILKSSSFSINIMDLRGIADRGKKARELTEQEFSKLFDLEVAPLIRFSILRMEDEKYLMLLNMHHIISDGWSMNIFTREFLSAYNSFRNNEKPVFEPLRIQYKDYSAWRNALIESPEMDIQKEYWHDKLSGEIPVLNLPSDKKRPLLQSFNGGEKRFSISGDISDSLNGICREKQISLFMMLQALVKILFHRYTGQNDIILGSPVAGRMHEDLEDQIGFYVNTLIFRDTIAGDQKFNDFLESVKMSCSDALDNQDYPFDRLVEELDIKRDISRSPFFDVMVILQNNDETSIELDGLKVSFFEIEHVVSKYDMTFNFVEEPDGLYCNLEYNSDIYSEDRMGRMVEHFNTLALSVAANPESRISDLEIISREERNLLLNIFNDTKRDYPKDKTIIQLFEEQVEKTPENVAVVFEDMELTYRELNGKTNIVGNYLRDNYDIKPDDLVGVMLDRSEKMIVALLGILKSGAAYVPIDPEYPEQRIDSMIEDSSLQIVISDHNEKKYIDIGKILRSGYKNQNPEKITVAKDIAYVIYTSGSTGKPKGTLVTHGSVVNFIQGISDKIDFRTDKTILSVTTISFDIFVTESFLPLSIGQRIVLANKVQQNDPFALKELIEVNQVDMIQSTPSRIRMLTSDETLLTAFSSLTEIMVGGESFPEDLLEILYNNCDGKIYNMYGPTETTVWSTLAYLNGGREVHIGSPIANTQIYILDKNINVVPIGVYGELYIAGNGLSGGYLNRPEFSEEKFVANPFISGEKMYRTGDLACWRPDGNLELAGRKDNQVKIRGYRIELGEIENILLQNRDVESAIVIAKDEINGVRGLIAYYVSDVEVPLSELRSFLGNHLPDYMIPSYFIQIDSIPLTPNGKIDRKALPEPAGTVNSGVEYVAPRNETEEKLVGIWQKVLGVEQVGIYDNFFDLGGHSLKATRVVSLISRELEVDISLKEIFTNPTISGMESIIKEISIVKFSEINKVENKKYYKLSSVQNRMYFLQELQKENLSNNIPMIIYLSGKPDIDRISETLSKLIYRHESLRTSFEMINGEIYQKIHNDFNLIIEESICIEGEIEEYFIKFFKNPFDLSKAPLIRTGILSIRDESRWILMFDIHHIVFDGVSCNIFKRDFIKIYQGYGLSKLKLQYKDYSEWHNSKEQIFLRKQQEKFWLERFSGNIPILDFPTDKDRSKVKTNKGSKVKFEIGNEELLAIRGIVRDEKITLFIFLLSLYNILLSKLSGQDKIIVGTSIAGRRHADLEQIIGMFVNNLALVNSPLSSLKFNDFLGEVAKSTIDAFDNQDYLLEDLVDKLNIKRIPGRNPLFDVMFVLNNEDSHDNESSLDKEGMNKILDSGSFDNSSSQMDLKLRGIEIENQINFIFEYSSDLFNHETVEMFANYYKDIVSKVISNKEILLKDISVNHGILSTSSKIVADDGDFNF